MTNNTTDNNVPHAITERAARPRFGLREVVSFAEHIMTVTGGCVMLLPLSKKLPNNLPRDLTSADLTRLFEEQQTLPSNVPRLLTSDELSRALKEQELYVP